MIGLNLSQATLGQDIELYWRVTVDLIRQSTRSPAPGQIHRSTQGSSREPGRQPTNWLMLLILIVASHQYVSLCQAVEADEPTNKESHQPAIEPTEQPEESPDIDLVEGGSGSVGFGNTSSSHGLKKRAEGFHHTVRCKCDHPRGYSSRRSSPPSPMPCAWYPALMSAQ